MRSLLALALVLAACVPATAPKATGGPGAVATPEPAAAATPASASSARTNVMPDAGVLYLFGAEGLFRYDGATGALQGLPQPGGGAALLRETRDGAYAIGRHGGVTFLRWDGGAVAIECGEHYAASVTANGACAALRAGPEGGVYVRLAGERRARRVLPADWGATEVRWSPDGGRLALLRTLGGAEPLHNALWVMDLDGALHEVFRPPRGALAWLWGPTWSPDGAYVVIWESTAPPGPVFAAGARVRLVEVASGRSEDLGISPPNRQSAQWSRDGRLAWVAGSGSTPWEQKTVAVHEPAGTQRVVFGKANESVGLAPAWDPVSGRLAYLGGPWGKAELRGYVSDLAGTPVDVSCPDRVVEGIRWATDGDALLLLCRGPEGAELWLRRLDARGQTAVPLVTGLGDAELGASALPFSSLFAKVAWSRAAR